VRLFTEKHLSLFLQFRHARLTADQNLLK
jgi:hypothetical protein